MAHYPLHRTVKTFTVAHRVKMAPVMQWPNPHSRPHPTVGGNSVGDAGCSFGVLARNFMPGILMGVRIGAVRCGADCCRSSESVVGGRVRPESALVAIPRLAVPELPQRNLSLDVTVAGAHTIRSRGP